MVFSEIIAAALAVCIFTGIISFVLYKKKLPGLSKASRKIAGALGDNSTADTPGDGENAAKNAYMREEDILEAYVTNEENIDTIGLELVWKNIILSEINTPNGNGQDACQNEDAGRCILDAEALKQKGDFEGAIISYMQALDKHPDQELILKIVLDICTIYKSLGQEELAIEILEGYIDSFDGVMDASAKNEIEKFMKAHGLQI